MVFQSMTLYGIYKFNRELVRDFAAFPKHYFAYILNITDSQYFMLALFLVISKWALHMTDFCDKSMSFVKA